MKTLTLSSVVALSSIIVSACSSDDPPAQEKKDVQVACSELCTTSGFTTAKKDEQPNEVNCFCSVTTNAVTSKVDDTNCKKFCSSIGKSGGKPFGATSTGNADSCQCE